jgi:hypothetical protein
MNLIEKIIYKIKFKEVKPVNIKISKPRKYYSTKTNEDISCSTGYTLDGKREKF